MKEIPIIFISVHSSEVYKIIGLESGADDFITKPFNHGELLARVKAVLRRSQKLRTAPKLILKDDLFTLDLETRTAIFRNNKLKLTPKEFSLITLFMKSKGKVLTRDVLSSQVWGHENLSTSRTIDVHIARLRRRLGKYSKVIETVGKVGYRYNPK